MAVTVASFVVDFPEFKGDYSTETQARIQSAIDRATVRTPADVWGDLQDQGIAVLAAHLLALTPYGVNAKLSNASGKTVYQPQLDELRAIVRPNVYTIPTT